MLLTTTRSFLHRLFNLKGRRTFVASTILLEEIRVVKHYFVITKDCEDNPLDLKSKT